MRIYVWGVWPGLPSVTCVGEHVTGATECLSPSLMVWICRGGPVRVGVHLGKGVHGAVECLCLRH